MVLEACDKPFTEEDGADKDDISGQFLLKHSEKEELNQYWYSGHTTEVLIKEIESVAKTVAFVSTPSVYFSLQKASILKANSWLFDIDQNFSNDPQFVFYDFRCPSDVPKELWHTFDCVVIDPPFITEDVWERYVATARLLSAKGGKVILSSIPENGDLLYRLFKALPCVFRPSIPNLVYQYNFFTNYETTFLSNKNPEIPCSEG